MIFILIGGFWTTSIYLRGKSFLPKERKVIFKSYSKAVDNADRIKNEMMEILHDEYTQERLTEKGIVMMWMIIVFELFCGIMYLLAGLSLLRKYSFSQEVALLTISLDVVLKFALGIFQKYLFLQNSTSFVAKKIISDFFIPEGCIFPEGIRFLLGTSFFEMGISITCILYIVYVIVTIVFFTRGKIVEYLKTE